MDNLLILSTVVDGTAGSGDGGGGSLFGGANTTMVIVLYVLFIIGAMYFFSIRPQKKRRAQMEDMRSGIEVGDSVLLANGMYGKVADVTAECYVIEFGINKGVLIPVIKQEVYAKKEPNLTNKVEEVPVPERKSFFGKKKEEE